VSMTTSTPDVSSPTATPVAPSAISATVPDISCEGMTGCPVPPSLVVQLRSQVSSAKVIAAACTATWAPARAPGPARR
jgi:hypothetical protein